MDVKRHNGNVLPKKPRTLVRGFLIFRGYACCATKTGKSPSSNNPAPDVRNASCTATPATTLHPMSATLPAQRLRQQPCIRRPQRFLHSDSGNNPASDVRNADALSVNPGPRPGL